MVENQASKAPNLLLYCESHSPSTSHHPRRTAPRVRTLLWTVKDLASYLGVSEHWIYKRTQKRAEDPPPRCPGMKQLRFNPDDPAFRRWLERQIMQVDWKDSDG